MESKKTKEVPIIIMIMHEKSCGMSCTAITVNETDENIPKEVRAADSLAFHVKQVQYDDTDGKYTVAFNCDVDDAKLKARLEFDVSREDYDLIAGFFANGAILDMVKDSTACIMYIKKIMDYYDNPMIKLAEID